MVIDFVNTGKCIWCGKSVPDVTFGTRPHIVPQKLGGNEIGMDVCDDCNHYFGTAQKGVPSVDMAFKEIFNAFKQFGRNTDENTHKRLRSAFFDYRHKDHRIKIKPQFNSRVVTEQFKRGLYEVFLQKYHAVTGNGNHQMFNFARRYARYGEGKPHVFYAFMNILFVTENDERVELNMSDITIEDMMKSGLYRFWLFGHIFYIEVLPVAFNAFGRTFLQKEANTFLIPVKGNERIYEFSDVMDIDFCMQRFNP